MTTIDKKQPPKDSDIEDFLNKINFKLPAGFIDFYKSANGAYIRSDEAFTKLWPITEMIQENKDYEVEEYAPEFFIFGSDGGGTAFAIEKSTGHIFDLPFIGMLKEDAIFLSDSFTDFIKAR